MYINQVDFPYGETYRNFTLPYEKITSAHQRPGLYVWYLRIKKKEQIHFLKNLFHHKKIKAKITSSIRFEYEGDLEKKSPDMDFPQDIGFFSEAIFCVNYPLYIGISVSLRDRLKAHKEQFEYSLLSTKETSSLENAEEDSDDESRCFGNRLAKIWPKGMPTDCLYIKYVIPENCLQICPEDDKCRSKDCKDNFKKELIVCEYFLNSLFNPVFGRR